MTSIASESPVVIQTATVRYPDNFTDFMVSANGLPVGYFTLRLGGGDIRFPAFIIGQPVPPGMEANYLDQTTRIVNGALYVVNSVYQFNITEELLESQVIPPEQLADILLDVFTEKSGVKVPREALVVMAQGPIRSEQHDGFVHYMVQDLVFAKAKA